MAGLLILGLLALWGWLVLKLSRSIARRFAADRWRRATTSTAFVALFLLPVADEVVGGFQFRALCANAREYRLGVEDPRGRETKVFFEPSNRYLQGKAIPIRHTHEVYRDIRTGEQVLSYDRYTAEAGLLGRRLGLSSPVALGNPSCRPAGGKSPHLVFGFKVLN